MSKNKIARYRRGRRGGSAIEEVTELATKTGVGFAGYAITRFLARVAYSQLLKRFPRGAEHAAVGVSLAGAIATFLTTRYWQRASDYHEPATVGAGIALLQAILQTYVPKFGWVVSDARPEQYAVSEGRESQARIGSVNQLLPPEVELDSEPDDEHVSDSFDLDALLAERPDVEAVPLGQDFNSGEEGSEDDEEGIVWEGSESEERSFVGMLN